MGGIEIFYQLSEGKFVCHLSDDWDFGIKVRASGEAIVYSPAAKVFTNPRRIDHTLHDMIQGIAYGRNGIIAMQDIRPGDQLLQSCATDLSADEDALLYGYSVKDFITKHILLPALLTPSLLEQPSAIHFLSQAVCEALAFRIAEIKSEMQLKNFIPIHSYKTPCFRLYFEFCDSIFASLACHIDAHFKIIPPLPQCLQTVLTREPECFKQFVHFYCEDRESGEAHNYFGNGGVF